MKIKLKITPTPNGQVHEVSTNLLCIAEWEKQENRKVSDGRGIGITDMVFLGALHVEVKRSKDRANCQAMAGQSPRHGN